MFVHHYSGAPNAGLAPTSRKSGKAPFHRGTAHKEHSVADPACSDAGSAFGARRAASPVKPAGKRVGKPTRPLVRRPTLHVRGLPQPTGSSNAAQIYLAAAAAPPTMVDAADFLTFTSAAAMVPDRDGAAAAVPPSRLRHPEAHTRASPSSSSSTSSSTPPPPPPPRDVGRVGRRKLRRSTEMQAFLPQTPENDNVAVGALPPPPTPPSPASRTSKHLAMSSPCSSPDFGARGKRQRTELPPQPQPPPSPPPPLLPSGDGRTPAAFAPDDMGMHTDTLARSESSDPCGASSVTVTRRDEAAVASLSMIPNADDMHLSSLPISTASQVVPRADSTSLFVPKTTSRDDSGDRVSAASSFITTSISGSVTVDAAAAAAGGEGECGGGSGDGGGTGGGGGSGGSTTISDVSDGRGGIAGACDVGPGNMTRRHNPLHPRSDVDTDDVDDGSLSNMPHFPVDFDALPTSSDEVADAMFDQAHFQRVLPPRSATTSAAAQSGASSAGPAVSQPPTVPVGLLPARYNSYMATKGIKDMCVTRIPPVSFSFSAQDSSLQSPLLRTCSLSTRFILACTNFASLHEFC